MKDINKMNRKEIIRRVRILDRYIQGQIIRLGEKEESKVTMMDACEQIGLMRCSNKIYDLFGNVQH